MEHLTAHDWLYLGTSAVTLAFVAGGLLASVKSIKRAFERHELSDEKAFAQQAAQLAIHEHAIQRLAWMMKTEITGIHNLPPPSRRGGHE